MLRKVRTYLSWLPEERRHFHSAWLALAGASVALRVLGLERSIGLVGAARGGGTAITQDEIDVLGAWLQFAARKVPGNPRCLECSLALLWQLRRRGVDCDLKIGVKKNGAAMAAHAWLERGGAPISEPIGIAAEFSAFKPVAAPG